MTITVIFINFIIMKSTSDRFLFSIVSPNLSGKIYCFFFLEKCYNLFLPKTVRVNLESETDSIQNGFF